MATPYGTTLLKRTSARLHRRYPAIRVEANRIVDQYRCADGTTVQKVIVNQHFVGRPEQLIEAGLVDADTLAHLVKKGSDRRSREVTDENGVGLYALPQEGGAWKLTRQMVTKELPESDEPRGMHGRTARATFRRLWRRIAQNAAQSVRLRATAMRRM